MDRRKPAPAPAPGRGRKSTRKPRPRPAPAGAIDDPVLVKLAAEPLAILPLVVPRAQIREVMGPGLAELRRVVADQRIAVTGPWFTHHLRMDPEVFDLEIGLPVVSPVVPAGRVRPGWQPACTVARTIYRGDYEGLPAAWGEFSAWIEAQGHVAADDLWERYVVGPEAGRDPAEWRTELVRRLARAATPRRAGRRA